MCNLNILIKPNNKTYLQELQNATATSYSTNSDSEGIYLSQSNRAYKSLNKLNLSNYKTQLQKSNFIISHQRISTSGYNFENTQPFLSKKWVLVHNGILDIKKELTHKDKSDTAIFFSEFLHQMEKERDIKKAIENTINATCENWNSYSIFIYNKVDKIGYYFKNSKTNINIYRLKDNSLYIATNSNTHNFFNNIQRDYKVTENILYKIEVKDKKVLFESKGKIKLSKNNQRFYTDIKTSYKQKPNNWDYVNTNWEEMSQKEKNWEEQYYNKVIQEQYKTPLTNKKATDLKPKDTALKQKEEDYI